MDLLSTQEHLQQKERKLVTPSDKPDSGQAWIGSEQDWTDSEQVLDRWCVNEDKQRKSQNIQTVTNQDVGLDKEHHQRVWIWQEQEKDNRPDIKDCAQRLKQDQMTRWFLVNLLWGSYWKSEIYIFKK